MTRPFDVSKFRKTITKSITGVSTGFKDPSIWLSTGNYTLNYLISGDFKRGVPMGKVTIFAGESGAGKSYIVSGNIVKSAQEQGIFVVMIDSENALDESWLHALGVDTSEDKLLKISAAMIDDVAKIINDFVTEYKANYLDLPDKERPKVLFVVDSLGMLMTPTEVNQFQAGDMKGDMGRKAKQLKALVTNCVNMFGTLDMGMVCTNHTYESQDMFNPDPKVSGGCLVPGSKVIMEDLSRKNIEDIEVGDIVKTIYGYQPVTNLWHYTRPTFSLTLSDGEVIECSPDHKFLVETENGLIWVRAEDIAEGDEIVSIDNGK